MIDKEKLLEEISTPYVLSRMQIIDIVKNFPEEPAIDFDALLTEHNEWCQERVTCRNSKYSCKGCFAQLLKSKNLTHPQVDMDALRNDVYASIQKPRDIPVKKTWTLKKEYEKYSRSVGHTPTTLIINPSVAPNPEFYDYAEEVDYSQIPNGSIVCVQIGELLVYRKFGEYLESSKTLICYDGVKEGHFSRDQFVRVVEWAKE